MFQFKEINAKLSNANVRAEIHGDDTKIAVDLQIELRGPNTILDEIAPGLLPFLNRKPEEGEDDQPELDLDPGRLSKLAFPMLAQPLKWEKEYSGYKHHAVVDPAVCRVLRGREDAGRWRKRLRTECSSTFDVTGATRLHRGASVLTEGFGH